MPDEDGDGVRDGGDEERAGQDPEGTPASEDPVGADEPRDAADDAGAHLRDVDVGAGCTDIWEHLAERRRER